MSAVIWEADAEKALESRGEIMDAAELDHCANLSPTFALKYAAKRLTAARLDDCASRAASVALEYAFDLLTDDRVVKCLAVVGMERTGLPVDAAGQRISFPTGGFYSIALGDRYWGSKSEFVDYIKQNGFIARPDLAMGRRERDHDGRRNAPRSGSRR